MPVFSKPALIFVFTLYSLILFILLVNLEKKRKKGRALKEANILLSDKDRIKNEYVLRVTHDIKGHLAAIQSCIEPVTGGITGPINERQADLLQRADRRTESLISFVKALLEVTRIKLSKEIKMDYFSFMDILSDAVSSISSKAKAKNISVNLDADAPIGRIRGAREYIQEAIVNLLANSVKYTPDNGRVNIRVKDKGNSILTEIEDTGIGIPRKELPKIFDEFYRSSNAKHVERDGTGLGLSIAKQVVNRHKGKIWVESEEGKGSTFYMVLPK